MSLLDDASLIVTPNAYKEGKLYSVIPSNGNGDFSVTRATTATRVNAAGLVELVPYNLLQYSEQFDQGIWIVNSISRVANDATAPNGTLTAEKIRVISGQPVGSSHIQQNVNKSSGQLQFSCSSYLKAAELNSGRLFVRDNISSLNNANAQFNLSTGVISIAATANGTFSSASATITNVGNGWYRCTLSFTSSTDTVLQFRIGTADTTITTGNGIDGIFVWGAQFVEGTSALDYQMTETRLNIPRLDYSQGSCPALLLEPQRTNLALSSDDLTNATYWSINSTALTSSTTTSILGANNAFIFTETTASATRNIFAQSGNRPTSTSGATYTFSAYFKQGTRRYVGISVSSAGSGIHVFLDTTTWAITDAKSVGVNTNWVYLSSQIVLSPNSGGWYRLSVTFRTDAALVLIPSVFASDVSTSSIVAPSYLGDGSTFICGQPQLEAGAYPTSYIPTSSASVTRNADQVLNTSATSLIGQTEGTIYAEFISTAIQSYTQRIINLSDGTISNAIGVQLASSNHLIFYVQNGGINQVVITKTPPAITLGSSMKIAAAYKENDFVFYVNGVQVGTDTSGSVPTTSQIRFTEANGTNPYVGNIKSAALWKTRLTNAQLAALTA